MNKLTNNTAFSLVEVVLALAIAAFCLVSLLSLWAVSINTNRDSAEETAAAHIAQTLTVTRRGAPYADLQRFPIPPLTVSASAAFTDNVLLDSDGNLATADRDARYRLIYTLTVPADLDQPARLFVRVCWPARAPTPQNIQGAVELFALIPQQAE